MKLPAIKRLSVLFMFIAACWCPFAKAPHAEAGEGAVAVPQAAGTAVWEYSRSAEQPVLEYQVAFAELADSEPTPRVQVYGDGRVSVHRPAYMKRPGDYELRLSEAELQALLASVAANGVIDFDENRAREAKRKRIQEQFDLAVDEGRPAALTVTADGDVTTLAVFLDRYIPADPGRPVRRNLAKRATWRNLAADAREHPQIQEIVRLAAAAGKLSILAEHPRLVRIQN